MKRRCAKTQSAVASQEPDRLRAAPLSLSLFLFSCGGGVWARCAVRCSPRPRRRWSSSACGEHPLEVDRSQEMLTGMVDMGAFKLKKLGEHYFVNWECFLELVLPFVGVYTTGACLRTAPGDNAVDRFLAVTGGEGGRGHTDRPHSLSLSRCRHCRAGLPSAAPGGTWETRREDARSPALPRPPAVARPTAARLLALPVARLAAARSLAHSLARSLARKVAAATARSLRALRWRSS